MRKVVWTGLAIALGLTGFPLGVRAQSAGTCLAINNADDGQAVSITVDGWSGSWDFAPHEGVSDLSINGERIHSSLSNGGFSIHWTGSHTVSWQWVRTYTGGNGGNCTGEWVGYIH
ncbi:MAG TPA: hypothetical protein VJT32_06470 [bacterium]|nr:hypothetical protein [bacterium]